MELVSVRLEVPQGFNLVLAQSHFIQTVEDVHEALVGSAPVLRFGLGFCDPVEVIVAVTAQRRGILGVVDGPPPLGVEAAADVDERRRLLRTIGYRL